MCVCETYFFLHAFIHLLIWHPLSTSFVPGSGVGDEDKKTELKQAVVPDLTQHTA